AGTGRGRGVGEGGGPGIAPAVVATTGRGRDGREVGHVHARRVEHIGQVAGAGPRAPVGERGQVAGERAQRVGQRLQVLGQRGRGDQLGGGLEGVGDDV